jgi:hypothetical protein
MSNHYINLYSGKNIITSQSIDTILEPARIFARSYGLLPFKIEEIKDTSVKTRLLTGKDLYKNKDDIALNLVILAIRPVITHAHINDFIAGIKSSKKISGHSLDNYRRHIEDLIIKKNKIHWPSKQANLALDIIYSSAKDAGAGFNLLNDFDKSLCDELIGLKLEGFAAYTAIALYLQENRKKWPLAPEANN